MAVSSDYELMLKAYEKAEGRPSVFADSSVAHLVVHKNRVLGSHLVPGLEIDAKQTPAGVDLLFHVLTGVAVEQPVHLCFGVLPESGTQTINIDGRIEEGAAVDLLAHCVFPNAVNVRHQMQASIDIGKDARYGYNEIHYHGLTGGAQVIPRAKITLGEGSILRTAFKLVNGRIGELDIDYEVDAAATSISEMTTKVFGFGTDRIRVREKCVLSGRHSRGLINSRVAVSEKARCEVISEMAAAGEYSRGHVDCIEIVQDDGRARAVPIVDVFDRTAKVTHEAAIGSIDNKQLETIMARGLSREKAVEVIIKGMLGT